MTVGSVPGGGEIRAQVQPGHLVRYWRKLLGHRLAPPAEAFATVRRVLEPERDVLTLMPEGKVMSVQVETGGYEATPLGDILLPTLGATLEHLMDHLACPVLEELQSDIGETLSVQLQPGRMPTACVRFAEPDPVYRWYRILSEALRRFLHGRQLIPPARLEPA